jgi:hypothetical protein
MTVELDETGTPREAQAHLERAYIQQYLVGMGHSFESLKQLPKDEVIALMRAASMFASMRMSEVEARSDLVDEMHGGHAPM